VALSKPPSEGQYLDKVAYVTVCDFDDGTEIGAKVAKALEGGADSVILEEDGTFTTRIHKDGRLTTADGNSLFPPSR
jgi:hypothetical protein